MANAKISNDSIFVPKTDIIDVDGLAGFKGSGNVKISGSALVTSLESNMSLSNISGTLSVAKGGTGQTSYTDGQLLIGNTTGNTLTKATLTQGTDLSITNGNGSITLDHAAVSNTPATNSTTLSAGGTFTAINSVTVSSQGHLTAQNTETYTLPSDSDTTYAISAADGDASDEEKIVLTAGGSGSGTSTVVLEASTGLTVARSTDKITFANSAPDQTVVLTAGTGITTSGTYPNFTITNSDPNQATLAAGSSAGELQYTDGNGAFQATSDMVYTTDQLKVQNTLYLDGNGSDAGIVKLGCESAGANHYVGLEGPTHAGSNSYIIKFPDPDPSVGKILKVSSFSSDKAVMEWADDTDTSIYAADGSLTGARTVTMGANNLTFASTTAGQEVKFEKNVRIDGQSYTPLETISSTNSWTPDWDSGNVQTMELTAATTINNPSNIEVGATYIMILKQDGDGSHTVTWGNAYNFPGATPPTLTTGANKADVITLVAYSSAVLMCTSVLDFETT
jgi:hypothetical protein